LAMFAAIELACIVFGSRTVAGQGSIDTKLRFSGFYLGMNLTAALTQAKKLIGTSEDDIQAISGCEMKVMQQTSGISECVFEMSDGNGFGGYFSLSYKLRFRRGKLRDFTVSGSGNLYALREIVISLRQRLGEAGRRELREIGGYVIEDNCYSTWIAQLKCRATQWTGAKNRLVLISKFGFDDELPFTDVTIVVAPRIS